MEHKFADGDVRVKYVDMGYGVHEHIHEDCDGTHTVFINSRDSYFVQEKSKKHAIEHITGNDYDIDSCQDVQQKELRAHGMVTPVIERPIMSDEEIQRRINAIRKRRNKRKKEYEKYKRYKKLLNIFGLDKR